jgi:hypothetical protein
VACSSVAQAAVSGGFAPAADAQSLGATVVRCVAYIPYSQRSCCEARVPDTIISHYG